MVNQHLTLNQADSGRGELGTFEYTYDASSNVLTALQTATMDKLDADRWYTYDTLNRITKALVKDVLDWSTLTTQTSTYAYDEQGDRLSHSYRDAASISYGHNQANEMTTLANLSQGYDAAGNQTVGYSADRGTSYTYHYDHLHRLASVYDSTDTTRKAAFTYDALGRRVEFTDDKLGSTTRYYYDGANEVAESEYCGDFDTWSFVRGYIHGASYVDERLMMKRIGADGCSMLLSPRPYYYVLDRLYRKPRDAIHIA